MMDAIFWDEIHEAWVIIYMDNIFIFTRELIINIWHTQRIVQKIWDNDLFVKPEKCVLNPKFELMTFIGYPTGTKGYLFMRSPNNVLYTAVQALFDETLYLKCPDMRQPGFTPLMPSVSFEGELSKISQDVENDDYGGADFDIQGWVPGEPLVPMHTPAQPQGDADQTPINSPDHKRSDPFTPSSPSDDD